MHYFYFSEYYWEYLLSRLIRSLKSRTFYIFFLSLCFLAIINIFIAVFLGWTVLNSTKRLSLLDGSTCLLCKVCILEFQERFHLKIKSDPSVYLPFQTKRITYSSSSWSKILLLLCCLYQTFPTLIFPFFVVVWNKIIKQWRNMWPGLIWQV